MASSFLIDNILRKESEELPTSNILYDFFYFLKSFEGSTKRVVKSNETTSQLLSSEVKKQNAGQKTRPAVKFNFISYEHFPK